MFLREKENKKRRQITIKDVAEKAGVSYSTVSRALNDYPGTNEQTKAMVKKIAQEMGYTANELARSLVTKRSQTVGFILPDLSNPFFTDILSAINKEVENNGYDLLICETHWQAEKEKSELEMLMKKQVDGVLLYPAEVIGEDRLLKNNKPMVIFDESPNAIDEVTDYSFIAVNNIESGYLAVSHALEYGYRKIVYLGGPSISNSNNKRLAGIGIRLAEEKLSLDPCDHPYLEGDYTLESGYDRTRSLLSSFREDIDCFICANDLIALGCMSAVEDSGFKIGGEIGVIGFDDIDYAGLPQIQLTTVRIPRYEMGQLGVINLMKMLDVNSSESEINLVKTTMLYPNIIIRNTTKRR